MFHLAARIAAALMNNDLPQKTKDLLAAVEDGRVSQAKVLDSLIKAGYAGSAACSVLSVSVLGIVAGSQGAISA